MSPLSIHKDHAVVPKEFGSIAEFYTNAFYRNKPPYVIKIGTPISEGEANDFPSPRLGLEEGTAKNYELLPNFLGEDFVKQMSNFVVPGVKDILK